MNDAWTAVMGFLQHPVVTLVSLILAAVSVAQAIRSRRLRRPRWAMRSNNLISGFAAQLTNLEVKYADRKVENLTISKVLFWNAGAETINRDDVADSDPLRIAPVGSVTLLDFRVLKFNNAATRFAVVGLSDGAVGLDFDFLDKGQGAVIQVIHTGQSSADLAVRGTVKGAGAARSRYIKTYRSPADRWLDFSLNSALIGFGSIFFAYGGYRTGDVKGFILGSLAMLFFCAYAAYKFWYARMPRGLEDYARD